MLVVLGLKRTSVSCKDVKVFFSYSRGDRNVDNLLLPTFNDFCFSLLEGSLSKVMIALLQYPLAITLIFTIFWLPTFAESIQITATAPIGIAPYIGGVPSLATPDPVYATSKPRPLVYGAIQYSYRDFAIEYGIKGDGTANPVYPGDEIWAYFTTSNYDVRTNMTTIFDDGFQGMVPFGPETMYFDTNYVYVDCNRDGELCGTGFASLFFGHDERGEQKARVVVETPGMMHISYHGPSFERESGEWQCAVAYHYFKLPLREKGWQRNAKIVIDRKDRKEIIVPAFPEPREQVRNVMFGRDGENGGSGVWGEEGEWRVIVEPTVEGGVFVRRSEAGWNE